MRKSTTRTLPTTDSIQHRAKFWDSHDLTEFEDQLEKVDQPVFVREEHVSQRLQRASADAKRKLIGSGRVSQAQLLQKRSSRRSSNKKGR